MDGLLGFPGGDDSRYYQICYDACKEIKADPTLKDVPVVFLSAKGQEAEIRIGMDAGAEEYLLKPFAPDQLTERVRAVLAKFGK